MSHFFSFPHRSHNLEIMDTHVLSEKDMGDTLRFLSITNAYFGGTRVVLKHLEAWSKNWTTNEPISILDIGCGSGDIALAISRWAQSKNKLVSILAIDLVPTIVKIAESNTRHRSDIQIEEKNFFDLVSQGRQFDYVLSSLFLHHTVKEETTQAIGGMDKLARRGVLISDLVRSFPSYVAVSSCSLVLGNKIVRHDGPLSVRRSFTLKELTTISQELGLSYLKAQAEPWFRLSLFGEKTCAL